MGVAKMKRMVLLAACMTGLAATAAVSPFKPGERVLFYGDSITHGGKYIFYLQLFENLRHPGSGVRLMNGGRSGGTAWDGLKNFERELQASRPDRAVVMFGMNDISRSRWMDEVPNEKDLAARTCALANLRANMTKLVQKFTDAGLKPALMTPTPYDQYNPKAGANIPFCNEPGAASAAAIVRDIVASNGLESVELHAPMTKLFKKFAGDFVFCRDRVHPGDEGHLYMAALILDALGASPDVGEAVCTAAPDQERVSFAYAPKALPFPRMPEYETIQALYPFTERLNREIVRIDGLKAGRYTLAFDGQPVGDYSAEDLKKGVNVALLDTPNQQRAQTLVPVMRKLQGIVAKYRNVVLVQRMLEDEKVDPKDAAAADAWLDKWLDGQKDCPWYAGVKAWADGYREGRAHEAETLAEIDALYAQLAAARPASATVTATRIAERDPAVVEWEHRRRGEVLDWFSAHQFGRTPIGRTSDETIGPNYVSFPELGVRIDVTCHLPEGACAGSPVPVFLFGDLEDDMKTPDFQRAIHEGLPIRDITSRGYAFVRWNFNDVCPNASSYNKLGKWPIGVIAKLATGDATATNVVRRADSWGTLGAWAWGFSRVMDWIESRPELDSRHVAIVGHSRGGKTALWAGAQDRRFAMVVSNASGCGGASRARTRVTLKGGESFREILETFPNWFCPAFTEWIGRDAEVTHDADDLIRLIAPRLVYVASGDRDEWACPPSEKAALDAARDLYRAYGAEDRMGYHCHEGPHKLHPEDWTKFMDFANRHFKRTND